MKKISLLALALIVVFAGCGKKKCDKGKSKQADATHKVVGNSDIPVLSQETENLVDSGDVSDFAFVDDEVEENKKLSEVKDAAPVATNQQDYALVENNVDEEEVSSVPLKSITFDLNKNNIRKDQVAVLESDCNAAKDVVKDGKSVVVQGHCCQLGSYSYNMALSQRRADIVKKEMVKRGIPANSVKTVGCGNEIPLVWSSKTDRASLINELAPNRRAEVIVN